MTTNHLPLTINHKPSNGQVMLEFTFCMIILFLMMYGIIMVFRWVGMDLGQRQKAHESALMAPVDPYYGDCAQYEDGCVWKLWSTCVDDIVAAIPYLGSIVVDDCVDSRSVERGPLSQLDPYFYTPEKMNAVWAGD